MTIDNDELYFDSVFTFGKYKGDKVEDVIDNDPSYMAWMVENDVASLSSEVVESLAERKII